MSIIHSPANSPLALRELDIPGRTGPVSSGTPPVWGINRAAALDNFPQQGLLCRAGPWGSMGIGDKLVIYWGADQQAQQDTIDQGEVDTTLSLFVPSALIQDGPHKVSYVVTRLGQTPEKSEVMEVVVKLTRPGGHDDTEAPGHPKLIMTIPPDILEGGIDKDNVAAGVPITIGPSADGPQPYLNTFAGEEVIYEWVGSKTGTASDKVKLTSITAGKPVQFSDS